VSEIVAGGPDDALPMSIAINAALTHLIETKRSICNERSKYSPETLQKIWNTSVLGFTTAQL